MHARQWRMKICLAVLNFFQWQLASSTHMTLKNPNAYTKPANIHSKKSLNEPQNEEVTLLRQSRIHDDAADLILPAHAKAKKGTWILNSKACLNLTCIFCHSLKIVFFFELFIDCFADMNMHWKHVLCTLTHLWRKNDVGTHQSSIDLWPAKIIAGSLGRLFSHRKSFFYVTPQMSQSFHEPGLIFHHTDALSR